MTTLISSRRHRTALRALVAAALLAVALGAMTGSAHAAASACGMKVIDDWYDNGRVDGSYPLRCYDDAIDALPRDVLDYSSAKGDITRALQARMNGQPTPPATNDPTPADPGTVTGPRVEPGTETGEGETETNGGPNKSGDDGGVPEAGAGDVDTASSDSVPVPLLVLAGLALLLVAAGSVGYLTRRLQARRLPPPS